MVYKYGFTINDKNKFDETPFMLYLKWNKMANSKLFNMFIQDFNANVNIVDKNGNTTLHWALSNWKGKQSVDMIQFLMKNGCKHQINIKNNNGQLPQHMMDGIEENIQTGDIVIYKKDWETIKFEAQENKYSFVKIEDISCIIKR